MDQDKIDYVNLETHETKDVMGQHVNGSLTVIWRDWDDILKNEPKMVYITTVNPGEIKGPHLHKKRTSYLFCVNGKVEIIVRDLDGKYHEIETSEKEPKLIQVPKKFASAYVNLADKPSTILVLADIAWRPDDNEMENLTFSDYNWEKWK